MLRVEGLGKGYGGGRSRKSVFRNVSFELHPHEPVAVFGPNGVGKSTLLRCVAGLILADEGTIALEETGAGRRSRVGFLFDGPRALRARLTARENLRYFQAVLGVLDPGFLADAQSYATRLGLTDLDRPLQLLSRGSQQKVGVALGLAARPHLLVCDEPSSFLDEEAARELASSIAELAREGTHVLIATHNARFAAHVGARPLRLGPEGMSAGADSRGSEARYQVEFYDVESCAAFVRDHALQSDPGGDRTALLSAANSNVILPYMERGEVQGVRPA